MSPNLRKFCQFLEAEDAKIKIVRLHVFLYYYYYMRDIVCNLKLVLFNCCLYSVDAGCTTSQILDGLWARYVASVDRWQLLTAILTGFFDAICKNLIEQHLVASYNYTWTVE